MKKSLFGILLVAVIAVGVIYWLRRNPQPIPAPGPEFKTAGGLQIFALDVGQGDGLLVIAPSGKTVLIDAGPVQAGASVVAALQRHGVATLDLIVATHPHADHIGGLRRVLETFKVQAFLDSGQDYPSDVYAGLLRAARDKRVRYIAARRSMNFDLGGGVRLDVYNPQGDKQWITKVRSGGSVENANSVVLRLSYGRFAMVFTGDAEFETEALLLKSGLPLGAQILKVGHHGSRYATSGKFLDAINPQAAVISCGDDNRYSHPAQATLDRLRKANVQVHRTDLSGEIAIASDGNSYRFSPARRADTMAMWIGRLGLDEGLATAETKSLHRVASKNEERD